MQKSGFFNALYANGEYDRKYNANDYCDNLAAVIGNGVLRGFADELKVRAIDMVVTVGIGRAWINGHYYYNDTQYSFAPISAPIGGARYDRVVLRLNNNLTARNIELVYLQGTASNSPTPPAYVREGNIYDLVLADIYVGANATSVTINDQRVNYEICGWVHSTSGDGSFFQSYDEDFNKWLNDTKDSLASVTLFKRYNWRTVLESATNVITFNIPQYDAETCFIEVFVNGLLVTEGVDYEMPYPPNIGFPKGDLIAGTEIEVKCYKSIDGTGIMSVAEEMTELQNAMAALHTTGEYEYICNGFDDNVKLSSIAQDWLNKHNVNTTIKVYGHFGAQAPVAGTGEDAAGFQWLALGLKDGTQSKITFDFTCCDGLYFQCRENAKNIIFYGADVNIIGAHVQAAGTGNNCNVIMFSGRAGEIKAENCEFSISTSGTATIAESGTFTNCNTMITSISNNAAAFAPVTNSRPLIVYGGRHLAYCGSASNYFASVFYTAPAAINAVLMAYGVTLPKVDRQSYYQTYAALTDAGKVYISGITTMLGITKGANCEVYGHIQINKA